MFHGDALSPRPGMLVLHLWRPVAPALRYQKKALAGTIPGERFLEQAGPDQRARLRLRLVDLFLVVLEQRAHRYAQLASRPDAALKACVLDHEGAIFLRWNVGWLADAAADGSELRSVHRRHPGRAPFVSV
jgi:hypothetical protein